jgi:hypothetical protein
VVFVVATFYFRALPPEFIVILAFAALASVVASGLSFWHTHIRRASPGMTFLYAQAVFDLALVTTVVHVTEGANSQFPALYILVIGVSAVLMPMASSLLVTSLAGLLYLADIALLHPEQLSVVVWLQISVFVTVSFVTGFLASRVRVMGAEREVSGAVCSRWTARAWWRTPILPRDSCFSCPASRSWVDLSRNCSATACRTCCAPSKSLRRVDERRCGRRDESRLRSGRSPSA